jgi:DNA polymerase-3 subunit delta'
MAFTDFPNQEQGIGLLQRSLERGRLAHGYLFSGSHSAELEGIARTLAKALNCEKPLEKSGIAVDCCDACLACRKIDNGNHADVLWVRPESRMRVVKINQITRREGSPPRVLNEFVNLKPTEAEYKVGIIVGADRMNEQAANAFLKTLEEPPAKSILILLTTEPQRILETIQSRCLRLNFGGGRVRPLDAEQMVWLRRFSDLASAEQKSLLGRYRLMDVLLKKLTEMKERIEQGLTSQSPIEQHKDADKNLREQWEDELKAAIEAEYRRQRSDLLNILQGWLRDAWLQTLGRVSSDAMSQASGNGSANGKLLMFPEVPGAEKVAKRITPEQGMENLQVMERVQRWLHTNVQEALALEVGLLKLHL